MQSAKELQKRAECKDGLVTAVNMHVFAFSENSSN
jgi:hypothetical protein